MQLVAYMISEKRLLTVNETSVVDVDECKSYMIQETWYLLITWLACMDTDAIWVN